MKNSIEQLDLELAEKYQTLQAQINALHKTLLATAANSTGVFFSTREVQRLYLKLTRVNNHIKDYGSSFLLTHHQQLQAKKDALQAYDIIEQAALGNEPVKINDQTIHLLKNRNQKLYLGICILVAGLACYPLMIALVTLSTAALPLSVFMPLLMILAFSSKIGIAAGIGTMLWGAEDNAVYNTMEKTLPTFFKPLSLALDDGLHDNSDVTETDSLLDTSTSTATPV